MECVSAGEPALHFLQLKLPLIRLESSMQGGKCHHVSAQHRHSCLPCPVLLLLIVLVAGLPAAGAGPLIHVPVIHQVCVSDSRLWLPALSCLTTEVARWGWITRHRSARPALGGELHSTGRRMVRCHTRNTCVRADGALLVGTPAAKDSAGRQRSPGPAGRQ